METRLSGFAGLLLYFLFPAFVTHGDVTVVAAQKDLVALGEDVAAAVQSGVYRGLAAAGADGFYFRQGVGQPGSGGLPLGVTVENILDRQSPRNRRIAELFALCGLVERSGQGMNLMVELSVKEAKALPDFGGTDDHFVKLTLNGIILDKRMLSVIGQIGNERMESLATADFLVINALYHDMVVPEHLRSRLGYLAEMGIVEQISRGRYVLARSLYSAVGQSGVHTRKVGLDRETNKELLLKHIRESREAGAPFKELRQVLPSLTDRQIKLMLYELRDSGFIYSEGKTRAMRWHAAK